MEMVMRFKDFLHKFVRYTYAVIGVTSLVSLIWAIIKINKHLFYSSMGFFGSLAFFILLIGGFILGVKSIANKT
jgi:hypothetical protein